MTPTKKSLSTKTCHTADKHEQLNERISDIIEQVTVHTEKTSTIHGIVIGRLTGFKDSSVPCVDFPLNPTGHSLPSRATVAVNGEHIGREVALMFEMNDVRKPVIIGLMHAPEHSYDIVSDGDIVSISAEREIHITCGDSSIRMDKNGKIEIEGMDIVSRASRRNDIKGGMIKLN